MHESRRSLAAARGMRTRLAALIAALRARGVRVSVAESIDAATAVAAVGVERPVLADALAAALVKDEGDRAAFDACFAEIFPARVGTTARSGRRRRAPGSGDSGGTAAQGGDVGGASGEGGSGGGSRNRDDDAPSRARTGERDATGPV